MKRKGNGWYGDEHSKSDGDRKMEAFYAEFPICSKQSEPHQHEGAEFIYVMKGRLVLSFDGDEIALDEGDATYFDPAAPHSYRRGGRSPCCAIVVTAVD